MIIWIASYPRSGNTFFRILLHELYGAPTYSGFLSGDDITLDVPGRNPTGHEPLPAELDRAVRRRRPEEITRALDELEAMDRVFFIKTHNTIDELYNNNHRAIVLVRDGRDVVVSFGWYLMNVQRTFRRFPGEVRDILPHLWQPRVFAETLLDGFHRCWVAASKALGVQRNAWEFILGRWLVDNDRWTQLAAGWLDRADARTSLVQFESLIADPLTSVRSALAELDVTLPLKSTRPPTFDELKQIHPQFFRAGKAGGWRTELPEHLARAFETSNREGMRRFGYLEAANA